MILLEVMILAPLAHERTSAARREDVGTERRTTMRTSVGGRLDGLVAALRFAWVFLVSALVVAIASSDPRGRVLAVVVAAAVIAIALAANARQIVTGRQRDSAPAA